MTKVALIGDIHGNWIAWSTLIDFYGRQGLQTIQVGDLGVGFPPFFGAADPPPKEGHRFIRGNHDNPHAAKLRSDWIKDGHAEENAFFCGGAWSIDQHHRLIDVSWWKGEELTYEEGCEVLDIYEKVKPTVVVTHDCTGLVTKKMFNLSQVVGTSTGTLNQMMLNAHRPKLWVFGHWHQDRVEVIDGTTFVCLGINSSMIVDLETGEHGKIQVYSALLS